MTIRMPARMFEDARNKILGPYHKKLRTPSSIVIRKFKNYKILEFEWTFELHHQGNIRK